VDEPQWDGEKALNELAGQLESTVEELESLIAQFDPYDLLANLIVSESFDPDKHQQSTHHGRPAHIEFLALLLLKKPYGGTRQIIDEQLIDRVRQLLNRVFTAKMFRSMLGTPKPNVIERYLLDELLVRGPAYPHHAVDAYRKLFQPFEAELRSFLGFSAEDAISVFLCLEDIFEDKRQEKIAESEELYSELLALLKAYRSRPKQTDISSAPIIADLAKLSRSKGKKELRKLVIGLGCSGLGDVLSVTADDVAEKTGLSTEACVKCLKFFSVEFGSVDADFVEPQSSHCLKKTPAIHHKNRYLFPNASLMLWATKERLESILKPEAGNPDPVGKLWKRYDRNRAAVLESEALRVLGDALSPCAVHPNLTYEWNEGDKLQQGELDGLIVYDNKLLLVEAKGGGFTEPARRGAEKRIEKHVKELIAEAHAQSLRTRDYIRRSGDTVVFMDGAGNEVIIDCSNVTDIFLVTVTFETMDAFTAMLHETADLGLFQDDELPWAVSIFDLRVICELVDHGAELILYLRRRLRLNLKRNLRVHDELDWFGLFLKHGLYFDSDERFEDVDFATFNGFTDDFDAWYFTEMGFSPKTCEKPALPVSEFIRGIIGEADKLVHPGYSDIALTLLDMSEDSRTMIETYWRRTTESAESDGKIHNFVSVFSEGNFGLSLHAGPESIVRADLEKIRTHLTARKYASKVGLWVGLLSFTDQPGQLHGWQMLRVPWKYDDEMEGVVDALALERTTD
jgi:hypothetical protein